MKIFNVDTKKNEEIDLQDAKTGAVVSLWYVKELLGLNKTIAADGSISESDVKKDKADELSDMIVAQMNSAKLKWLRDRIAEYKEYIALSREFEATGTTIERNWLYGLEYDHLDCDFDKRAGAMLPAIRDYLKERVFQVQTNDFKHKYHYSERHGGGDVPEYICHNIKVFNSVMGLHAAYTTGLVYGWELENPRATLKLDETSGADTILIKTSQLHPDAIAGMTDSDVVRFLHKLSGGYFDNIRTKEDFLKFHEAIIENQVRANKYLENLAISPIFKSET